MTDGELLYKLLDRFFVDTLGLAGHSDTLRNIGYFQTYDSAERFVEELKAIEDCKLPSKTAIIWPPKVTDAKHQIMNDDFEKEARICVRVHISNQLLDDLIIVAYSFEAHDGPDGFEDDDDFCPACGSYDGFDCDFCTPPICPNCGGNHYNCEY